MSYQPFTNPLSITVGVGGIVDGGNVVEGATTDTAVTSDAPGTISAKLRGLVKILSSAWDSINGRLIVDASKTVISANILNIPPVTVSSNSAPIQVSNFPTNAAQETGGVLANSNDLYRTQIVILESIRRAIVSLAIQGGQNSEVDFDPAVIAAEAGRGNSAFPL